MPVIFAMGKSDCANEKCCRLPRRYKDRKEWIALSRCNDNHLFEGVISKRDGISIDVCAGAKIHSTRFWSFCTGARGTSRRWANCGDHKSGRSWPFAHGQDSSEVCDGKGTPERKPHILISLMNTCTISWVHVCAYCCTRACVHNPVYKPSCKLL